MSRRELSAGGEAASISRFLREKTSEPTRLWSMARHRTVGAVSDRLLGEATRELVRGILTPGGDTTLAQAADWADRLKQDPPPSDEETEAFLAVESNRESHGRWHYLNLPYRATSYDEDALAPFIPNDGAHVVAKISECVNAMVAPSETLSRTNALRWLAHLVGDLHQPMHLGCTYIDLSVDPPALVGDPAAAEGLPHDRGGGQLMLPEPFDAGTNLHGYWDGMLGSVSVAKVLAVAEAIDAPLIQPDDIESVVAGWVNETLIVCKDAVSSIESVRRVANTQKVEVKFADGLAAYEELNEPHVLNQMAVASVRLAALVTALVQ